MFAAVALLPVLAALASATVTPTDIAVLEANWKGALLTDFTPNAAAPQGILEGDFVNATIGTLVPQADTATQPNLTLNALSSFTGNGTRAGADAKPIRKDTDLQTYTVFLVDANYAGTTANGTSQNLHWMENGVTLGTANDGSYPLTFDKATNTKPYAGPGPSDGSGSHRYMFLLYEQPADFAAPEGFTQPIDSVNPFSLPDYVTNAKLGNLVGANYIQVENGQSTVSAVSTSAVDTATISVADNTASGSGSATAGGAGATGTGGAASTATGSAKAGESSAPAATTSKASGAGVVAPAVGLAAVAAVAALLV